jgi:multicomponent Na+:H+ antiporter subunit D
VSFSPDGKRIVSGSGDKTLKVWDAETGQLALTLDGHSDDGHSDDGHSDDGHSDIVTSVSFSPDGKQIVSGSGDDALKVWDAETGQLALTLDGHSDIVTSVSFSPDGKRIVSGSEDKTLKVWDLKTGHLTWIFLALTLASAGTFLHTGLKLPYYMFFGKDSGIRAKEPPKNMLVAMGLAATACVVIGVVGFFPSLLYQHLPHDTDYIPYTVHHVTSTLGMLAFTALGFFLLLKHLDPEPKISLDTDWFYRRGSSVFGKSIQQPLARYESKVVGNVSDSIIRRFVLGAAGKLRKFDTHVIDFGVLGVGRLTQALSRTMKTTVSGNVQHYALLMIAGVLALLALAMILL